MLRVVLTAIGTLLSAAAVIGAYLGLSALVLWTAGRLLPLAGRGRRR